MKSLIIKLLFTGCGILAMLASHAQLPLQQGDMVITYKYGLYDLSNPFSTNVVSIIKSRNTTSATPGSVWNSAGWYSNANWTTANLGNVFGIAIDQAKNIYLSSTSVYGGGSGGTDRIFMINGSTEAVSVIASHAINTAFVGPYGNLKIANIGGTEYMYVSDWGNGFIHRLKNTGSGWQYLNSLNPEFGRGSATPLLQNGYTDGQLPYGLNIRNVGGGQRLYYARMGNSYSRNHGSGMTNGYPNDIWYINLDATGDFVTSGPGLGETLQTIPYDIGNTPTTGVSGFRYQNPFADIAFSKDGTRMLLAQQPLVSLTFLGAHSSEVREVVETSTDNWTLSTNKFPTGNQYQTGTPIYQTNAVGGISYSNSILYGDEKAVKCDTTVWAVSDFIFFPVATIPASPSTASYTYGLMGYGSAGIPYYNGTTVTSYQTALLIDADNEYGSADKYHLGDVEVYNAPLDCSPCACGEFSVPTLNGNPVQKGAVPLKGSSPVASAVTYQLNFVKGNVSGLFNIKYTCKGNCSATTKWTITKDAGGGSIGPVSGTGDISIDFSTYSNRLDCGAYTLTIVPTCNGKECDPFKLNIVIVCEPPSCCPVQISTDKVQFSVNSTTNPAAASTLNGTINFSANAFMSAIRMEVEEFRLQANSQHCLLCSNRPQTWGNILRASFNGIPGKLFNGSPIPSPAMSADYREAVFAGNQPIDINNGKLIFSLSLPAITDLDCCDVSVYLCIKVTFRDNNCKECVQMICKEIKLAKPKQKTDLKNETETRTEVFKLFN
ncbi:MAG: hypothetical protein U0X40_02115 [Ferruginibacter sp.]